MGELVRRTRDASVLALLVALTAGCQGLAPSSSPEGLPLNASPSPSSSDPGAGPATCPRPGEWTMEDPRITESSGLARSTVHPGVLYTHNDRGGAPSVFAVDGSGTRAVLRLDVAATDWEDIATTSDGMIWVADTGDNDGVRESVQLHVAEEPDTLVSSTLSATTYDLRYPDGPHDAEALLVDPADDRVYLVTKDEEEGRVYQAPEELDPEGVNELRRVGTAPANVTGGDFSPDGRLVALRNQGKAYFATEPGGATTELTLPSQPQGESITFTSDGLFVLVGSEGVDSTIRCMPTPRGIED